MQHLPYAGYALDRPRGKSCNLGLDRHRNADRTRWGENDIDCERSYAAELVALATDVIRCQHP